MYFTDTPTLNSIEAIMKKLPYGIQKGGGRFRSPYKYTKKDCDCRLCLYYRKKTGCTVRLASHPNRKSGAPISRYRLHQICGGRKQRKMYCLNCRRVSS